VAERGGGFPNPTQRKPSPAQQKQNPGQQKQNDLSAVNREFSTV
jgi:hypothetical protein